MNKIKLKCLQPKLFWVRNPPKMSQNQNINQEEKNITAEEYDEDAWNEAQRIAKILENPEEFDKILQAVEERNKDLKPGEHVVFENEVEAMAFTISMFGCGEE
jgi:hypothetical protein